MTNNKQQTAVEWLIKIYLQTNKIDNFDIEQAKEMEKQRIETAYNKGTVHGIDYPESTLPLTGEQYYEQTYGGGEQ
jgi:hypothetical protein